MFKLIIASLFLFQAFATTYQYSVTVTQNAANEYRFLFSGLGVNPTLSANVGDTIVFQVFFGSSGQDFTIHTGNTAGITNSGDRYSGVSPQDLTTDGGTSTLVIGPDTPAILYYVSETASSASGEILIFFPCNGVPDIANSNSSAGNCTAGSANGTVCTPVCNTGYTGTLSATCYNGTYQPFGNCISNNPVTPTPIPPTPTPTTPTPTPSPSVIVIPTGGSDGIITYTFTIDGTSSNNCDYVTNTVVPDFNTWGQSHVETEGDAFYANLTSCDNTDSGSTFTINAYVSGTTADVVVTDENSYSTVLKNHLQDDNSITVNNISYEKNSGLLMRASLLVLMTSALVAIMA